MTLEVKTQEDGKYICGVGGMVGVSTDLIRTEAGDWEVHVNDDEHRLLIAACRIAMRGEKDETRKKMLAEFCEQ
jgi:hypothetical protein